MRRAPQRDAHLLRHRREQRIEHHQHRSDPRPSLSKPASVGYGDTSSNASKSLRAKAQPRSTAARSTFSGTSVDQCQWGW